LEHGANIKFSLPDETFLYIPGGKLIFPEIQIYVHPMIITSKYKDELILKITNNTDKDANLPPGGLIPLHLISLSGNQLLKIELAKCLIKYPNGASYLTAGNTKKFATASFIDFTLLHNKTTPSMEPEQLNLLEMAENKIISATSFMVAVKPATTTEQFYCFIIDQISQPENLAKKLHLPLYVNRFRVIACADSGSDVTIMQLSLFKRLFPNHQQLLSKSTNLQVKSFSDNSIQVLGQVPVSVKFLQHHPTITLIITVVKNIGSAVPLFLFGNDSMRRTLATLSYTGAKNDPEPEIIIRRPIEYKLKTYFASPSELDIATGHYDLAGFETKTIEFHLHPAAPVIRTDIILISPKKLCTAHILESRSSLYFNSELDCFIAQAAITNLSKNNINGIAMASYVLANNYQSIPIVRENKKMLLREMKKNPPAKIILAANSDTPVHTPIYNIYNIILQPKDPPASADEEYQDAAGATQVTYTGKAEINNSIIEGGLELPTEIYKTPEEAIHLESFEPEIQPYIKTIFLDRYPQVVALHSLDSGDVSKTLGYTTLRLIPGEQLPRHRRIYQLSPQDSRYLEELLESFIRFNYVRRAPVDSTNIHLYGMSTYMVPRKKMSDIARLVIDFSPLTSIIQSPPSIVPDISASLQSLQGKALFTSMDLKYAYLALRISEESMPLTTFLTQGGAYQWLTIPTGAACSPAYFIDAINRVLHNRPVLDNEGNPVYEAPNKVKLERDILPQCFAYFDDINCATEPKSTYKATLDYHFKSLEEIIYRLAFHNVKISVPKCTFAKPKILFLGWVVTKDYIIPDPRRIEKIKNANFPQSKKEVRSFLGLVNSVRRVIPFEVIKEMQTLTPLTSSTTAFDIKPKHREAFEKIKKMLISQPLFCNLIKENATKYLWVDAASTSGCLGAVLAQRIDENDVDRYIPDSINLENPVHRIIYDNNLPYQPCKLYTSFPIQVPKVTLPKTIPPDISDLDPLHGFTDANVHDSLFWSIISQFVLYGCKIPTSTLELRKLATTELKKGILSIKLKDQQFNNNHSNYRTFLQEFERGQHHPDPDFLLIRALAKSLHRCFIFLSTLEKDKEKPIFKINPESNKPPLIFGLHPYKNNIIFTPYFYNKNLEFNIDSLRGKIQIIAYLAKTVPTAYQSRSILDLEVLAILTALHSLQRYISNTKCYLLTDSRVLYYLFHQIVGDSSVKIRRWVLKLLSDYPSVVLYFIRTNSNLADYLTRQGLPAGDLPKLNLDQIQIKDFSQELPKQEFTLQEWVKFCADHPEYLTVNEPPVQTLSLSIENAISQIISEEQEDKHKTLTTYLSETGLKNVLDLTHPLDILKDRLSRANIISAQKSELSDIYNKCLASENFSYRESDTEQEYILNLDLLMVKEKDILKIFVPPSLVGPLLSYTHLLGHQGTNKMLHNLQSYYFPNQYTITRRFVSCCYACFMTQGSNRHIKLGNFPLPEFPFEEVSVDLAEALNPVGGYSNLLIVQDVLTDYILIFPLKSKSAQEVCKVFLFSVLQHFNISKIHSDNGPCFRNINWIKLMAALNIQIINASANNPSSRGKAERAVGQVKLLLKKLLSTASSNSLNWDLLPFLCSKLMNSTVVPRTGFKPSEMIFGQDRMALSFLDRERLLPLHHLAQNSVTQVRELTAEIKQMTAKAQENLIELRRETHEKLNKNRIEKHFKPGDIVFVLDRYQIPGNSRPLKSKFHPSPFVVLKPYFTTCLVKRLADGFTALYNQEDMKIYKGTDPIFSTLPPEVSKVLLHEFKDLISEDFTTILKYDPLPVPSSIPLVDTIDPKAPENSQIFETYKLKPVEDEILPEDHDLPEQGKPPPEAEHDQEEEPDDIILNSTPNENINDSSKQSMELDPILENDLPSYPKTNTLEVIDEEIEDEIA